MRRLILQLTHLTSLKLTRPRCENSSPDSVHAPLESPRNHLVLRAAREKETLQIRLLADCSGLGV